MRLLIIEDEPGTAALVRGILINEGFDVDHAATADAGAVLAMRASYDGMLLDLGLGDRDGVSLLVELRRQGFTAPVLVLTGETAEATVVRALDAGADEYVMKPFGHRELTARVRALLRRRPLNQAQTELVTGTVRLDRLARRVTVAGTALNLSPKEFALLEHLMQSPGQVVSRDALLERVWGMRFDPGSNLVDVSVTRVRRKLEAAEAPVRIETRRGAGFRLTAIPTGFAGAASA